MKFAHAPVALLALATPFAALEAKSLPSYVVSDTGVLPPSADTPWPGVIGIAVDASDPVSRAFRTTQTIPLDGQAREIVLVYPKWLPGNHGPTGQIHRVGDLRFEADGQSLRWARVEGEPFAFRVTLPAGARELTAHLTYTSPNNGDWRALITPALANVQWEKMSLYPAGHAVRRIRVKPSLTLPAGWTAASALDGQSVQGNTVRWAETDFETLVDSPVFAGANARVVDLGNNVRLNVFADEGRQLEAPEEMLPAHRKLVAETLALTGTRQFDHYDFLVALTKELGGIGLEHHRSSENTFSDSGWTDWAGTSGERGLLPHEFFHSWNGKHRRPAGLWQPDYHTPTDASLLWVYEGQTSFWDSVLAVRSGLQPKEIALGEMAINAALYSAQAGRQWRSVEDTTFNPVTSYRLRQPYASLSRGTDYYSESALVWLEVDQLIRRGTKEKKGLDDFVRAFFGTREGDWGVKTYTFDDVVAALNALHPYDWAGFLDRKFRQPAQPAPVKGLEMAGYRLVFRDEPNPLAKQDGAAGNFVWSLGFDIAKDGAIGSTLWDSPAFRAGLVPGTTIVAVDGWAFSQTRLADAVKAAKGKDTPIRVIARRGERIETVEITYSGGLRHPWLEPVGEGTQPLDRLLTPRTK